MTTETLLPSNRTPLELALETAMRPGDDVVDAIDLIRTTKEDPPDSWLLWLVWEYGLDELLPYIADPRAVIEDGLQWQPIRGTPASIDMALAWIGIEADIEEEDADSRHWFEFQLWARPIYVADLLLLEDGDTFLLEDGDSLTVSDPNDCYVPPIAELRNIIGLARLSAPVGTRLSRMHNCYDLRRAKWDQFSWSDGSLYSANSGVYNADLDLVLSFGRTTVSVLNMTDWQPEITSDHIQQVAGQGIGRSLLIADGGSMADGENRARGIRLEIPQYKAVHTRRTALEEGYS